MPLDMNNPNWIMGLATMAGEDPQAAMLKNAQTQSLQSQDAVRQADLEAKTNMANALKLVKDMPPEQAFKTLVPYLGSVEALKVADSMRKGSELGKTKQNIIKDVYGISRDANTGEAVFPDVATKKMAEVGEQEPPPTAGLPEGYMWTIDSQGNQMATPIAGLTDKEESFSKEKSESAGYARRMVDATKVFDALEASGDSSTGLFPNMLQGAEEQEYLRAKSDFITAVLRRESGAVISDSEFETEGKKFFPVIGDGSKVLEAKAKARRAAAEDLRLQSGGAYESFYPDKKADVQSKTINGVKYINKNGKWYTE